MNLIKNILFGLSTLVLFNQLLYSQGTGTGTRINLTTQLQLNQSTSGQFAQIFVPDYFEAPADGKFDLVFHFHSASWAAENEVYKSHTNAVLFNIHLGGFSSSYQNYFVDQNKFQLILNTILSNLESNNIITAPAIKHLVLTSFSAGYAGIREILKVPNYYNSIDAITLADGLHSNSEPGTMAIQMQDFIRFAKDARDMKKIMLLTHSSIPTPGYASTTQTADYLINGIGGVRKSVSLNDVIGHQTSSCDTGYFELKGCTGQTAEDHLKHLYAMNVMLEKVMNIIYPSAVGINEEPALINTLRLLGNYPNPFNNTTRIAFEVSSTETQNAAPVELKVFDVLGKVVVDLLNGEKYSGSYEVEFNAGNLASGTYYYRLQSSSFSDTKKLILLR